eukprot:364777-Chlamydomonas_euryale.AAC.4
MALKGHTARSMPLTAQSNRNGGGLGVCKMAGCQAPPCKGCKYCEAHKGGRMAQPPKLGKLGPAKPSAVSASSVAPRLRHARTASIA